MSTHDSGRLLTESEIYQERDSEGKPIPKSAQQIIADKAAVHEWMKTVRFPHAHRYRDTAD